MRISKFIELNDDVTLDDGTVLTVNSIFDTTLSSSDKCKRQPNLKYMRYYASCKDGYEYCFIVFRDLQVSKVHKFKRYSTMYKKVKSDLMDNYKIDYSEDDIKDFFDFLNNLRDSGVTNMYGATPYLQDEYEMSEQHATKILVAWMKSF